MIKKCFLGILNHIDQWLFIWARVKLIDQARLALNQPGAVKPTFVIACLQGLSSCEPKEAMLWTPIILQALGRSKFYRKQGTHAFQIFIDWLEIEAGRLATLQFETGNNDQTNILLWQGTLDICHALLNSGAYPDDAIAEEDCGPNWLLPELCAVIGLHRSCPATLVQVILNQQGLVKSRDPVMDGRRCALAVTSLPNDWIEQWLTPKTAEGREKTLSYMLAWKVLGTGVLDDAGARLLRMLGNNNSPFSQTLFAPKVSDSIWRWRRSDTTWDELLDSAGRLGGWVWASDMLVLMGAAEAGTSLPACLSSPIERTDWDRAARMWIRQLGPPPECAFNRLQGQAGEALLLKLDMEMNPACAIAPGTLRQRSRAL